ncbi:hypothetical protein PG996_006048 [Apiospora saccharicola]|uniref:Tyrosinase copper-binding domain-containing protein n=1 Tax=Apiospora saccharicola TaxID=335842 RepID=A0ABR1VN69_9PEZI
MRVSLAVSVALIATGLEAALMTDGHQDAITIMAEIQKQATEALMKASTESPDRPVDGCSFGKAQVRQDWENLGHDQKRDYIRAVQCLADSPSKLTLYGWASKNRYDDFVGECGYKGYQPYWNWFKYADDLSKSPVFDGSLTSMGGGGGEYFPHNGSMGGGNTIYFPPGKGGGCVTSGPFNLTINIGPITPRMDGLPSVGSLFEWNPRLRRDLTMSASRFLNAENLLNITVGDASHSVKLFQDELQGVRNDPHGSGHFSMGADGTDLYASINDPAFWLHHSMLDRIYWKVDIAGGTVMREPDSPPAVLGDMLDVMGLDTNRPIKDLLDILGGTPLCYVYK